MRAGSVVHSWHQHGHASDLALGQVFLQALKFYLDIVTRLWARQSTVPIPGRARDFLFQNVQTGSGTYPASYQWVPGAFTLGFKWPGCEADHSPPFNAEVKNGTAFIACIGTPSLGFYPGAIHWCSILIHSTTICAV